MRQPSTLVLRAAILFIGAVVFALCAAIPLAIGSFQPGGYDPILLGLYIPAVPFFVALYQAMKILSYVDSTRAFSSLSVHAFKNIKLCAYLICGIFVIGMPYIFYVADKDDAPGVVAIALIIIFLSFIIGTFAAVMQKLVQHAVAIKSENDLTV